MRKVLIQDDVKLVEDKIKEFEINTGCELLIVVTDSSDPYPGASWRFGVMAGFFLSLLFSYYFEFEQSFYWPVSFLLITFFMTWIGHFEWAKKFALSDWEIDRETAQKAVELFHTLGTSKVSHKVTAIIMISILEREIVVIVDEELKAKISEEDLKTLVQIMQNHFKRGHMGAGLNQSIQTLEDKILKNFSGKVSDTPPSELKDTIIFI